MAKGSRSVIALALVAVVAAFLLAQKADKPSTKGFTTATLLEGLEVEKIASVKLSRGDKQTTLMLIDGVWGVVEEKGYEADPAKLNRFVFGLVQLQVVDRLSDDPEKYAMMGVGEPPFGGMVELADSTGKVVATLTMGNPRPGRAGPGGQVTPSKGQFVLKGGEPAVFVASTLTNIEADPGNWIRRDLLNVPSGELVKVAIEHRDPAQSFTASRNYEGVFVMDGNVLEIAQTRHFSSALNGVVMTRVLTLEEVANLNARFHTVYRAETKAGTLYEVSSSTVGDKHYITCSVEGGGDKTKALMKRLGGRTFEVAPYIFERLTVTKSSLTAQ